MLDCVYATVFSQSFNIVYASLSNRKEHIVTSLLPAGNNITVTRYNNVLLLAKVTSAIC